MGEKLRGDSAEAAAALARQGRYRTVAGNLRAKEVRIDDGAARDRFVICHNPDRARRDAAVRDQIIARLQAEIADSDTLSATKRAELAGRLKTRPAFNRFLRATPTGRLRIDRAGLPWQTRLNSSIIDGSTGTPARLPDGCGPDLSVQRRRRASPASARPAARPGY